MIILDTAIGDIVTIDNVRYQQVVVSLVVDKEADLPAQNALGNNQIMVAPSICHCTKESTDWQMDSTGAWFKQKSTQDVNATVQLDLTNYYTSAETDQAIEDAIDNIDLSNYYTKTQVDNLLPDMTLYYTSSQTDSAISTALSGYYTSAQVDSAISTALSGYYTSAQVDTLLGSYYTSAQTDSAISYYWTTNIANYYTKSEVDALIPTVPSTYDADDIVYDNTTSGLTATDVQDAIDEIVASIPTIPSTYDADDIVYSNTTSGLTATDVQAAIDEVVASIPTVPSSYDADDITYDNTTSGLTASNVQDAIDELAAGSGGGGVPSIVMSKNKFANIASTVTVWQNSNHTQSASYGPTDKSTGALPIRCTTGLALNPRTGTIGTYTLEPNTEYVLSGFTSIGQYTYYLNVAGTPVYTMPYTFTTDSTGSVTITITYVSDANEGYAYGFNFTAYPMLRKSDTTSDFEKYGFFGINGMTEISGGSSTSNAVNFDDLTTTGYYFAQTGYFKTGTGTAGQPTFQLTVELLPGAIKQTVITTSTSNTGAPGGSDSNFYCIRIRRDGTTSWSTLA